MLVLRGDDRKRRDCREEEYDMSLRSGMIEGGTTTTWIDVDMSGTGAIRHLRLSTGARRSPTAEIIQRT